MTDRDAQLEAAFRRLGAEHEPPAGWQARVLAAAAAPPRRSRWRIAVPVIALAALAVTLLLIFRPPPEPPALALAVSAERAGPQMRGAAMHLGEVLSARATGGAGERSIWIYRDDELVLACPGAPACSGSADAAVARLPLAAVGEYTIVALVGAAGLAPSGSLDADLARARERGVHPLIERVTVR